MIMKLGLKLHYSKCEYRFAFVGTKRSTKLSNSLIARKENVVQILSKDVDDIRLSIHVLSKNMKTWDIVIINRSAGFGLCHDSKATFEIFFISLFLYKVSWQLHMLTSLHESSFFNSKLKDWSEALCIGENLRHERIIKASFS